VPTVPLEPINRGLLLAKQCVDSAHPVSAVTVDHLFGAVLKQACIDLALFST
jgi:hypothetical protein